MADKGGYGGVEFEVDSHWRFYVPDLDRRYASYEEMTKAIDAHEKRLSAAKRHKIAIKALTGTGKPFTITGVHAGHGKAITVPKDIELPYDGSCFPDVPVVREGMAKWAEAQRHANHIKEALKVFCFKSKHSGGGYGSSHEYDGTPEGLEKLAAAKAALAEGVTLESLMAKTPIPKATIFGD